MAFTDEGSSQLPKRLKQVLILASVQQLPDTIVQSPAPTFVLLLLCNRQPLPLCCYYCAITSPHLCVVTIVQSPTPTFVLLLLCNHQPPPLCCYYCAITNPHLCVATIVQSPAPTFVLLLLCNCKRLRGLMTSHIRTHTTHTQKTGVSDQTLSFVIVQ